MREGRDSIGWCGTRGMPAQWSLCESGGRVFSGLRDGSLLEWDASTLEERWRLTRRCEGRVGAVVTVSLMLVPVGELLDAALWWSVQGWQARLCGGA